MAKARFMLDEATNRRGCLIELPWSAGSAEFTVTCQWDKTVQEPVWTLYQHEDDISKVVWTQGFAPSDLEFMYDILVMSAPKGTSQAKIPDLLKPQESSLPNPGELPPGPGSLGSSSASQSSSQGMSNQNISGNKAPLPQPNIGSPPGLGGGGNLGMPPGLAPGLGTGLGSGLGGGGGLGMPPGLGGGPASMPQQAPAQMPPQIPGQFPAPGYPQPGYPQPPMPGYPAGYPAPGMQYPPQGFPPQPGYGAPMPGQPYMPPQGYPMTPMPGQMPGQMPPNPYGGGNANMPMGGQSSSPMPMTDPSSMDAKPIVAMDYQLLDKRPNLLIGVLLKDAGLITEPALDAALKIQELIREGKVSPQKAPLILQKHHSKGAKIDQFLSIDDVVVSKKAPEPQAGKAPAAGGAGGPTASKGQGPVGQKAASAQGSAPGAGQAQGQSQASSAQAKGGDGPGGAKRNLKPAFDLLQKAGILTESDVKDALDVRQKIGGDLVSILESAGKLNKKTVDAAFVCLPLIREGLMKTEQCIIALNYCSRMRVGFDEALDEMGWQNPRKLRTDLPLY